MLEIRPPLRLISYWKRLKDLVVTRLWYPLIAQKIKRDFPEKIVLAANNIIDGHTVFAAQDHPDEDAWLVPMVGGVRPHNPGDPDAFNDPYCITGWHMDRHPGNCLYDSTDFAPRLSRFGNRRWNEYLPLRLSERTDWDLYDGTFWDSWASGLWSNADKADFDRNGVADGTSLAFERWLDGNRRIIENMRAAVPVGKEINVAHESGSDEYVYLNGKGFEFWKGFHWQWVFDTELMPYAQNAVEPRVNFVEGQVSSPENYSRMRFGLTTAMLADAYFSVEQAGGVHQFDYHYDEFTADIGFPIGAPQPIRPGLYVRYFTHGAVITNGSGNPQTIRAADLQGRFYRFQGGQQPNFNNGDEVTDDNPVNLSGSGAPDHLEQQTGDGILLFKEPGMLLVTDIIVDNVARNLTSPGSNPAIYQGTWRQQDMGSLDADTTLGYALLFGWGEFSEPYAVNLNTNNSADPNASARYQPTIGVGGSYEISLWHPDLQQDLNRPACKNVTAEIVHAGGTSFRTIDQQSGAGLWKSLGTYTFRNDNSSYVNLRAGSDPTNCVTASDSIRFVYRN